MAPAADTVECVPWLLRLWCDLDPPPNTALVPTGAARPRHIAMSLGRPCGRRSSSMQPPHELVGWLAASCKPRRCTGGGWPAFRSSQ